MKTKEELAQYQLDLMRIVREKANINIVTCGNCGAILLHEREPVKDSIVCFDCETEFDLSDCPDLFYNNFY